MAGEDFAAADQVKALEELRQLKARYCRFLDTKDVESWRGVFTTDVVVTLDMAVSTGGADPMTASPLQGVDNCVPMVIGGLENVARVARRRSLPRDIREERGFMADQDSALDSNNPEDKR